MESVDDQTMERGSEPGSQVSRLSGNVVLDINLISALEDMSTAATGAVSQDAQISSAP